LISVTSKRKEGTTFFIYLPALKTTQALEQPDSTVKQLNRAAKILVMDDEPMVLEVASSMIKLLGHKVVLASEGEEAVAKYEAAMQSAEPFDAVVLDLTIRGGLGGAEAMQRLQKIHPEVKAVVSSGYAVSDAVTKYRDHGFLAFLNKPYNLEGLRKVLDGVLN
jgi:CheY-like chemotaxis protein